MKFDDAVNGIGTLTSVRRIASAHVIDHKQLTDDQLRAAIIRAKPQYLHWETVRDALDQALYRERENNHRVLARLILRDVLLEEFGYQLTSSETEENVIAREQEIINLSNEMDLVHLAAGDRDSVRYRNLDLYYFVLNTAWESEDSKSPDEVNLLRKLRDRLQITEADHRLLEAQVGKFPKPGNELHSRGEINDVRRSLHSAGLLLQIRQEDGTDVDVIPVELAELMRRYFDFELRQESYRELLKYKPLTRKRHLTDVLQQLEVPFHKGDTVSDLSERMLRYVKPSAAIGSSSPRYGLNSEELSDWCRSLGLPISGNFDEKIQRIIYHYDNLRPMMEKEGDERARLYQFYEELARRDYETLRAQHVIDKDLNIEAYFEEATEYLFDNKLNHTPLRQAGVNNPDGIVSLQSRYVMWDNKSAETPVNLKDHIPQFDAYMERSDKPVPLFLVIAPEFTPESQTDALHYHARHFDRNIALITASELKDLADEWASPANKNREEPFPLGLLAVSGRYSRDRLGKLT